MGTREKVPGRADLRLPDRLLHRQQGRRDQFRGRGYNSDIMLMAELGDARFHTETPSPRADSGDTAELEAEPTDGANDSSGCGLTVASSRHSSARMPWSTSQASSRQGTAYSQSPGCGGLRGRSAPTQSPSLVRGPDLDADEVQDLHPPDCPPSATWPGTRSALPLKGKRSPTNDKYALPVLSPFPARLHRGRVQGRAENLLRNLSGNGAFKSGKRNTEAAQPEPPAPPMRWRPGATGSGRGPGGRAVDPAGHASFGEERHR